MSHRLVARVTSASAITALLLSVLAMPAAAAGHTSRWVDDDATAGDGPDQCDTAAYSSIQAAIDDSSSGDTVFVCPGTYAEQLTLDNGVRVWARPLRAATIQAPGAGSGTLVTITGNNAVLRGFRMSFQAEAPAPVLKPTFVACGHYDAAVWAKGTNDRVRDNFITAVGSGTLTGACGYDYGIL